MSKTVDTNTQVWVRYNVIFVVVIFFFWNLLLQKMKLRIIFAVALCFAWLFAESFEEKLCSITVHFETAAIITVTITTDAGGKPK